MQQAFDEIIAAVKPAKYFHVGMDEDHWRSLPQYAKAITRLHKGLSQRKLRAMVWNDTACTWPAALTHAEKAQYAETRSPRAVAEVLWQYWDDAKTRDRAMRRITAAGHELWGAPGATPEHVSSMRDALIRRGGQGILLTKWIPCVRANRDALIEHVRTLGPCC